MESVLGISLFALPEPFLTEPWGKRGHFAWTNIVLYLIHTHAQTCACSYAHTTCDQFQQLFTMQSIVTKLQWQAGRWIICCYGYNGLPRRAGQVFQKNYWCRVLEVHSFIVNLIFWSGVLLKMRLFKAIFSLNYQKYEAIFLCPTVCHLCSKSKEMWKYQSSTAL